MTRRRALQKGKSLRHVILTGVVVCCFVLVVFTATTLPIGTSNPASNPSSHSSKDSVLFLGDVMLARHVEMLMEQHSSEYPFHRIDKLLRDATYVVLNFEAATPETHIPTSLQSMRFSVAAEILPILTRYGITHVSLANNHTDDFGVSALTETRAAFDAVGIRHFGAPYSFTPVDTELFSVSGRQVLLVGLHSTIPDGPINETVSFIETVENEVLVVAYVHWGTEYEQTHSKKQAAIAHALIDAGADLIIGHHPHVVQDIEIYKGTPIIYSLGNTIFDQYFSDEVMEGLAVAMHPTESEHTWELTLIPTTYRDMAAAPRPLRGTERNAALYAIADRSDDVLKTQIQSGFIQFVNSE